MKKFLISFTIACASLSAWAVQVQNTAGELARNVTDASITELTITGTLDARDFSFIATELRQLTTLDLSGATIVAHEAAEPLFGATTSYAAGELPPMSLMDMNLQSLKLPAGLTSIGRAACAGCTRLGNVQFPTGLQRIEAYAFSSCKAMTTVALPGTLTHLGTGAFSRCTALTMAIVSPNADMALPQDAFLACTALANVSLGAHVTAIGDGAFAGCTALKSVGVTSGSQLALVGQEAFAGSAITTINFLSNTALTQVGKWAFANTPLVVANLPASVNALGDGAFFYNTALTAATLPASLTTVSNYLFAGDEKMTAAQVVPAQATTIGDYAFYNWDIDTFTIPAQVKYLGTRAMAGMTRLQSIDAMPDEVPLLGEDVWEGVPQAAVTLNVPGNSLAAYRNAAQWREFNVRSGSVRGDVDGNGIVNGSDVTALYNHLLSSVAVAGDPDVDGNGIINGADVTALYNILLGNTTSGAPLHAPSRFSTDEMHAPAATLDSRHTADVVLSLHNATPYTTFQLEVTMPRGLRLNGVTLGDRAGGMTVGYGQLDDNNYRILIFSPKLACVEGDNGALLTMHVVATDDFSGNDFLRVGDILCVEPNETSNWLTDVIVNVSGTTGVATIEASDDDAPVNVFNMQGQLLRRNVPASTATQGLPAGNYVVGNKKIHVK